MLTQFVYKSIKSVKISALKPTKRDIVKMKRQNVT